MQTRQVVAPPKPKISFKAPPTINAQDADFLAHSNLTPDLDHHKGRLLRASQPLSAGTILLVDTPYAIIPTVNALSTQPQICSNLTCSRMVNPNGSEIQCPKRCDDSVIWCNRECRESDRSRHAFECSWLKHRGSVMRHQEAEYDFITLWHVVRLLAGRNIEVESRVFSPGHNQKYAKRFNWGWEAILSCCDDLASWPEPQIKHWTRLAETYMCDKSLLPCPLNLAEMVSLICKEETNTNGLYPGVTGPLQAGDSCKPRGEGYGIGLYPRGAMFNHSCHPNVSHRPDSRGRMVYTAARNIAKGEECTIAYLDTAVHTHVSTRRHHLLEQFRFQCLCERCSEEQAFENVESLEALPAALFD